MRNTRLILTAGAVGGVLALAACGSSSTGPSPESLVGNWTATRAEFALQSNPATKVEIIHSGSTLTLALNANHTYTLTIKTPGEPNDVTSNTWTSSRDLLTLNLSNGEMQFDMTLSGNTLTLAGGHKPFDVNDDGQLEESIMSLVLTK